MSETVQYNGTATLISRGDNALIDAKIIIAEQGFDMSYCDDEFECLMEQHDKKYNPLWFYHRATKSLYSLVVNEIDPYEDIINGTLRDDGTTIDYDFRFYNGGTGFEECLEEVINKLR